MLSLDDLISAETRDEVLGTVLGVGQLINLKVTAWQKGSVLRTLMVNVSQKISDLTLLQQVAIRGGLLDYAEGGWLTLLALSLYRVERLPATAAAGDSITFTNDGDQEYGPFAPGELIIAHETSGKTYRNEETVTVAIGVTEDVVIVADEVGTGSNAGPGLITVMVTSLDGVTVTNVDAVLGSDEETDPDLRQRCRDKLGSLSPNGPKEAYAYIAKTPKFSATSVPITRTREVTDPATGLITQYLATASGAPSGDDVTIVDAALDRWATPWTVEATATAANEVTFAVTYQAWVKGSTFTPDQIRALVSTALAKYFSSVDIGGDVIPPDENGKIRVGYLERVIGNATAGIVQVVVSLPAADTELEEGDVAKLGTVTGTITVLS